MSEPSNQILSKLVSLAENMHLMESRLIAEIRAVDSKFEKVNDKVDAVNEKLDAVDGRLSQEIGQVKTAILEMNENIETILAMYGEQACS